MVDASAPLLGQGVHGLEHVFGLERPADQGEDSQPVEGEGLLEPLIDTGRLTTVSSWRRSLRPLTASSYVGR